MSTGIQYDEAWTRRVEAIYTTSDVAAQRRAALGALALQAGERVLDIGSGPGLLAREMGVAVGTTGRVRGVDVSEPMLALARRRCAGLPQVELGPGEATALPCPAEAFDAAVSAQVYEYVADVDAALGELARVLRPGGRAVVVDTDWDSLVWHSTDPARMQRVLAAFAEHCAHTRLPRTLGPRLRRAGLRPVRWEVFPLLNPRHDPDTYSHGVIEFIAAFVAGRAGITAVEAQAWAEELRALGRTDEYFFSLNRYLVLAVKPDDSEVSGRTS